MSYTNSKTFVMTCCKQKSYITSVMRNIMNNFKLYLTHTTHAPELLYAIGMLSYIVLQ